MKIENQNWWLKQREGVKRSKSVTAVLKGAQGAWIMAGVGMGLWEHSQMGPNAQGCCPHPWVVD